MKVYLVDYNNVELSEIIKFNSCDKNICIVNVLNGLGENLIRHLAKIKLDKIIIINCKPKVMERDLQLINKYMKNMKVNKIFKLFTSTQTLYVYII